MPNENKQCCPECNFKKIADDSPDFVSFGGEFCGDANCPCHTPSQEEKKYNHPDLRCIRCDKQIAECKCPELEIRPTATPSQPKEEEVWEKSCTQCGVFKPLNEFYRRRLSADGYNCFCKRCYLKYDSSRYYGDRENRLEKDKQRYQKNKDSYAKKNKRTKEKYPEKYKARQAVRNAVIAGRMKKLPCAKCGDEKSQAHHVDYKKPLDVVWLCAKHHMELHRKYARVN